MADAAVHTIAVTTHGRYLVRPPETTPARVAVVGFHGYGQRAEHLLDELAALPGAEAWLLVSVQGLHRFYERASAAGRRALDDAARIASWPSPTTSPTWTPSSPRWPRRIPSSGSCSSASRRARRWRRGPPRTRAIAATASCCSAATSRPRCWRAGARLPRTILGRGTSDAYYSAKQFAADSEALEERGVLAAAVEFNGGHEFSPMFRAAAGALIQSLA